MTDNIKIDFPRHWTRIRPGVRDIDVRTDLGLVKLRVWRVRSLWQWAVASGGPQTRCGEARTMRAAQRAAKAIIPEHLDTIANGGYGPWRGGFQILEAVSVTPVQR